MNNEYLKRIASFNHRLNHEDIFPKIVEAETKLQVKLPDILHELYQNFSTQDPIFSLWISLVPLEDLQIERRTCKLGVFSGLIDVITLFKNAEWSLGYALSLHQRDTGKTVRTYGTDRPYSIFYYYTAPKNRKQREYIDQVEGLNLDEWIKGCLGFLSVYSQPNVIALNVQGMTSRDYTELWSSFDNLLTTRSFGVQLSKFPPQILGVSHNIHPIPIAKYSLAFGAQSSEAMTKLFNSMNLKFIWLKTAGTPITLASPELEVPTKRNLLSIEAILKYICEFAGIDSNGGNSDILQKVKGHVNHKLPLPLVEYYQYLPKSFYNSYNTLCPLSSLRTSKDKKIVFLIENQGIYQWAIDINNPYIYQTNQETDSWQICGILDGFLAAEFIWELACSSELNLELMELSDFSPQMLLTDGALYPFLSDIADGLSQRIAVGNSLQLYKVMDGQIIGLYNSLDQHFWLIAKEQEDFVKLESKLNFPTQSTQ